MFNFRCSFILSTFFFAFSRSSFFPIPSSFKYAFNFLPKTFVVGIPYWSRRIRPIFEGACFSASFAIIFFNSGSFIFTQVGFSIFGMLVGVNYGF